LNKKVLKQIKDLTLGDLVFVSWFDASVRKKLERRLNWHRCSSEQLRHIHRRLGSEEQAPYFGAEQISLCAR